MWPFKTKQPERDPRLDGVRELKEFRGLGQTFNYLGRTCIVTGHVYQEWSEFGLYWRPSLRCDYVDDKGVIRQVSFSPAELPGLRAQNP